MIKFLNSINGRFDNNIIPLFSSFSGIHELEWESWRILLSTQTEALEKFVPSNVVTPNT
jgi:hypothetical protein